ncbi:MAG: DUF3857 domain-containing protein [Burkholderiaceae bacterium]
MRWAQIAWALGSIVLGGYTGPGLAFDSVATPQEAVIGLAPAPVLSQSRSLVEVRIEEAHFLRGAARPAWIEPILVPAETTRSDPIVVLLADTQLHVDESVAVTVHQIEVIHDPAALGQAGSISLLYVPAYQRVLLHTLRVHRDGQWHDFTQTAPLRVLASRNEGEAQGHAVTATLRVDDLHVGDELEIEYTIMGENPAFGGHFVHELDWDQAWPTVKRRVILSYPEGRDIAWTLLTDGGAALSSPRSSDEAGVRELVFEGHDLDGIAPASNVPTDYRLYRALQFSEFKDWDAVVRWANALFPPDIPGSRELNAVADEIQRVPDAEGQVAAALEFVQNEIRSLPTELLIDAYRPASPDVVMARRFGDCKDKTLLLMTLLARLGIPSQPELLQLGERHGLERSLPSPLSFNHVLLHVELKGRAYDLDATRTGQRAPLETMGQVHQGVQVLRLGPESHGPSTLPEAFDRAVAQDELAERARLVSPLGEAQWVSRQSYRGYRAENMRALLQNMGPQALDALVLTAMQRRFPKARLNGSVSLQEAGPENRLTLVAAFTVPELLHENPSGWSLVVLPPNFAGTLPFPVAPNRKEPVALGSVPTHFRYMFEVEYPPGIAVEVAPEIKSVRAPGFTLSSAIRTLGQTQTTTLDLAIASDRLEPADFGRYDEAVIAAQSLMRVAAFVPPGARPAKP